ncbi:MAG: hypothetical protein QXS91_03890, partial [Candidatus Anstonellales archaeon]
IIIALDNYDDLFSDFDIGPYETRLISADFIDELKNKTKRTRPEKIILTLPSKERNKQNETAIKKRLKDFFKKKQKSKESKMKWTFLKGIFLLVVGIMIYFLIISLESQIARIYDYALFPSWYISWKGLDYIFIGLKRKKEMDYYAVLQKADITFEDEERYMQSLQNIQQGQMQ